MLLQLSHIPPRQCLRYLSTSAITLSGHNKWSKIKEGKGANDQAKSRIYGKANRDILNAVRKGDSADPALNSALATAMAKAKEAGVPKANIQAALEQASKSEHNYAVDTLQLEAMVSGQVGLLVQCTTDNRNRTLRELKTIFKDHGIQPTTVSFMFEKKGTIQVLLSSSQSTDEFLMEAVDHGALDVTEKGPGDPDNTRIVEVMTTPDNLGILIRTIRDLGYTIINARTAYFPLNVGVDVDEKTRETAIASIEKIVDHQDVYEVYVSPQL